MVLYFIIVVILMIITLSVSVYINSRLFVYIKNLEENVKEQIKKNDNMYQSLKDVIADDFLLSDGRLKKFMYQKEKGKIYNGVRVEDTEVEI